MALSAGLWLRNHALQIAQSTRRNTESAASVGSFRFYWLIPLLFGGLGPLYGGYNQSNGVPVQTIYAIDQGDKTNQDEVGSFVEVDDRADGISLAMVPRSLMRLGTGLYVQSSFSLINSV